MSAKYNAAQRSTAQQSTAQRSAAKHSTAQRSAAQHSTAQRSAGQHSTAQHSSAQHSSAPHEYLVSDPGHTCHLYYHTLFKRLISKPINCAHAFLRVSIIAERELTFRKIPS